MSLPRRSFSVAGRDGEPHPRCTPHPSNTPQIPLAHHNSGHVPHTSTFAPWHIETAIAFRDKQKAYAYERHLKTGTGRAYATRHF